MELKVCVSLRDPCTENLRDSNLRGEPRWERQVLEALTQNPEVTDIFTSGYNWTNGINHSIKYRGLINKIEDNVILLTHDWNFSVIDLHKYKAIIVNLHHGPWESQRLEIVNKVNDTKGHLYFTYSYESFKEQYLPYFANFLDRQNIFFLPTPGAPEIYSENNFDKKLLLYPQRLVHASTIFQSESIKWALDKLESTDMSLAIVSAVDYDTLSDLNGKRFLLEFKKKSIGNR